MIFLNDKDIDTLKKHLELSIGNWLKDYTFTQSVQIDVSPIKRDNFLQKNGFLSVNENGLAVKYCDNAFEWENLIFSEFLYLCPRDTVFNASLLHIKKCFLKEVLNIDNLDFEVENNPQLFPSAIDAYVQISIKNDDIGCLDVFASHSYFALMIGKTTKSASINLESKESAIKTIKVPVSFSLDFGDIQFKDFLKIENGNVLVSTFPLENKFSVSLCDTNITTASMGKKSDHLAFLLNGKSA